MPVTFTTDACADITMFGDVALAILKLMGHSTTAPGTIEAEKSSLPVQNKDSDELIVSMANRGLTLINLLTAAVKAESNVM